MVFVERFVEEDIQEGNAMKDERARQMAKCNEKFKGMTWWTEAKDQEKVCSELSPMLKGGKRRRSRRGSKKGRRNRSRRSRRRA